MTTSLQLREKVTKKIEEKFSIFFENMDVNMRILEANSEKGYATALFEDNNTKDKVLLEWAALKSGFITRMIVGVDNTLGKAIQEAFANKLEEAKEACREMEDLIDPIPDYINNVVIPQTQFATDDLNEDNDEDDEEMIEKKKKKMKEAKKKKEEDEDDDLDEDEDEEEIVEKKKKKESKKKKEEDDDLDEEDKKDLKEALSELSIQNRILQKQVEHLQEASLKMAAELKQSRAASLNEILSK